MQSLAGVMLAQIAGEWLAVFAARQGVGDVGQVAEQETVERIVFLFGFSGLIGAERKRWVRGLSPKNASRPKAWRTQVVRRPRSAARPRRRANGWPVREGIAGLRRNRGSILAVDSAADEPGLAR